LNHTVNTITIVRKDSEAACSFYMNWKTKIK